MAEVILIVEYDEERTNSDDVISFIRSREGIENVDVMKEPRD